MPTDDGPGMPCRQSSGVTCYFQAVLLPLGGMLHLHLFGACPSDTLQVIELLPGMDSHTAWREAALLRDCTHERIVPLYGVALKVWTCNRRPPPPFATVAARLAWRFTAPKPGFCIPDGALHQPTPLPGPFDLPAGPTAAAGNESDARRHLERGPSASRPSSALAMVCQVRRRAAGSAAHMI